MYIRYEAAYLPGQSPSLTHRRSETLTTNPPGPPPPAAAAAAAAAKFRLGRAEDENEYQQQQRQVQELGICQEVDCSCVLEEDDGVRMHLRVCAETHAVCHCDAISSSRVLLVPYYRHHVPRYHEWMKNTEIQEATASEPLSEEQEYEMQASWRRDADKLTFIICFPLREYEDLYHQSHDWPRDDYLPSDCDSERAMLGDVNVFLTFDEEEEEVDDNDTNNNNNNVDNAIASRPPPRIVGELELMIAERKNQKCGYGRSALLCFLFYVLRHEDTIVRGFLQSKQFKLAPAEEMQKVSFYCVKIGANNAGSIRLFESLGFTKIREEPNVFGELELRREFGDTARGIEAVLELMEKYDVKQVVEVPYQR